jgi:hypothetical protein
VIIADENEELTMRPMHLLLALVLFSYTTVATQAQGTFTPTGDMTAARSFHTAVLLANGKVLIVGGTQSGSPALTTAEFYDPDTGTFTPVGNLESALFRSITLLGDGRVLLVTPESTGNRAKLYDPATGTLTESGSTATGQFGGQAILLNNGKVLIAGGTTNPQVGPPVLPTPIANPELYDPSTGAFTATGAFATKGDYYVSGGPAVSALSLLADGRVLIAGELTSEIYDPDTGMFALTSPMTTQCFDGFGDFPPVYISGRTATLLEDGRVLLTGGAEEECGRFANAELYDALKAKFSPTGSMMRARNNHAATLLRDGTVLITGGESQDPFGYGWIFSGTTASAESYDPSTGTFAPLGNMTERRAGHTATVLKDGRVLITGGYGYAGIGGNLGTFSTAEIYTPPVLVPPVAPGNFQFDRSSVAPGSSYIVNISGSNLTAESFFDIRFRIPGSTLDQVVLNWQRGTSNAHVVPVDLATGVWTVTGVRAHQLETDHTGNFFAVSATITVAQ